MQSGANGRDPEYRPGRSRTRFDWVRVPQVRVCDERYSALAEKRDAFEALTGTAAALRPLVTECPTSIIKSIGGLCRDWRDAPSSLPLAGLRRGSTRGIGVRDQRRYAPRAEHLKFPERRQLCPDRIQRAIADGGDRGGPAWDPLPGGMFGRGASVVLAGGRPGSTTTRVPTRTRR
jgi:hypothetical protein